MAQSVRSNSVAKSAAAHSSLTAVTYGRPAWDEPKKHGESTVKFHNYLKKYLARVNVAGRIYSGVGETKGLAVSSALKVAAEVSGLLHSDLLNAWYGDVDESAN